MRKHKKWRKRTVENEFTPEEGAEIRRRYQEYLNSPPLKVSDLKNMVNLLDPNVFNEEEVEDGRAGEIERRTAQGNP